MKTYQSHSHKISGAIHFLVAQIKKIRHRETQILAKVTQDLGCLLIGLFAQHYETLYQEKLLGVHLSPDFMDS